MLKRGKSINELRELLREKRGDLIEIDEFGDYDINLLNETLVNTKGKRLYSRYGKFYKEKDLSFKDKNLGEKIDKKQIESIEVEDVENEKEPIAKGETNFFNPYTGKGMAP